MSRIVRDGECGWQFASFQELSGISHHRTRQGTTTEYDQNASDYESIRTAEREAETILRTAREVAQQIELEASRDGCAKGRAEAVEEMRRRLEPLEALLAETCRQVAASRQAVVANTEGDLIDLAVLIAERVLRSELATHREALLPIIRAAIETVGSRKVLAIRINPSEYDLLVEHRGDFADYLESARFIPDSAISFGGCVVEVESGLIDARLESQLQEAVRLLGRDRVS